MVAKKQGCEMASITNSNEQFQAISAAALGWQLQDEETTLDIKAVWIGGKRIKAEGGGRNVDGSVDESPWRWSDGSTWKYKLVSAGDVVINIIFRCILQI